MKKLLNRLFGKKEKKLNLQNVCQKGNGEMHQYCKSEMVNFK